MTEPSRTSRQAGRSVAAVVAGLLVIVVASTAMDAALRALGVFPPGGQPLSDAQFLLATLHRTLISICGCYLTARLAPSRAMAHALALGGVGVAISGIAAIATWNAQPALGPHWYPLVLVAVSLPCAWTGGRLQSRAA